MPYLHKSEQKWWDRESSRLRASNFYDETEVIARRLAKKITIPVIKAAIEMHSSFYVKAKREGCPWAQVYDLEHIRKLEPFDIRVMLFIANLGFSIAETANFLGMSERSVKVHCEEAWRNLTKQWRAEPF